MMKFKGYIGRVEFDDEAGIFHGEVINTRDVITFQGKSVSELRSAFRASVRDYLAFCFERGEQPDKPLSGQFVTRIPPELHRRVQVAASLAGKSLNAWVSSKLEFGSRGCSSSQAQASSGKGQSVVTHRCQTTKAACRISALSNPEGCQNLAGGQIDARVCTRIYLTPGCSSV